MAKVYGIHLISLRLNADPSEFERYVSERVAQLPTFPGWTLRVLKGERGDRPGQYAVLFEIDDIETRDRFAPPDGEPTPDSERFFAEHPEVLAVMENWSQYATPFWEGIDIATDYVVIA